MSGQGSKTGHTQVIYAFVRPIYRIDAQRLLLRLSNGSKLTVSGTETRYQHPEFLAVVLSVACSAPSLPDLFHRMHTWKQGKYHIHDSVFDRRLHFKWKTGPFPQEYGTVPHRAIWMLRIPA